MYIVPQALVYQEFDTIPTAMTDPLRAFVAGPNYALFKYGVGSDAQIYVGQYVETANTLYSWPNRPAGAVVDTDYVRVFMKDALLRYFTSDSEDNIQAVAANKIKTSGTPFVNTTEVFPFTRNVQIGDVVKITAAPDGTPITAWTYVTGFDSTPTSASVDSVGINASNADAMVAAAAKVAGSDTGVFAGYAGTITGTDYKGCADGYPAETYTVRVVNAASFTGSGDSVDLAIISASGTDDDVVTAVYGETLAVGGRGLTMTLPSGEYAVGDEIQIDVNQTYDAPEVYKRGVAYTGTQDTTYIIEVVSGWDDGVSSDTPKLRVRTTNGYDSNAELISVVAANFNATPGSATPIEIGNYGISFVFHATTTDLVKGDVWTIPCYAEADDTTDILVLANSLPALLRSDTDVYGPVSSSSSSTSTPVLTVSLYKKKDIEVPVSAISDGHINWETSATKITINTGITAYDDEILDESGELLEMAVEGSAFNSSVNKIYVQYRALLQTYADSVYTMEDIGDVASTLGTIDSDNPLALGVFLAMTNANGTPVKYMAVPTDNLAGYSAVVDKLYERSDVYGLVPLSKDNAVQTLFAGHAANMSSAEKAKWRIAFLNSDATEEVALVSSTVAAETTITFTAEDGEYVIVDWVDNVPTNGGFLTSGVDDGDIIRTNYEPDGTYSEYIVDNVITETQLRLMAGPAVISDAPVKFEAWHTNSKNETAAAYALKSGSFGSRRVYHIWPDKIDYGTQLIEGYYLACAIAGLVSGVVPQQGLTNLEITGFTAVTRTGSYFNTAQLDVMAEGGTFIVTQDPTTGAIYTRHQLSTDTTDLNSKELSVVKNVDSISYVFSRELAPYIGVANVTPALLDKLKALVLGTINYLVGNGYVARIGGQLISAEITELRQHAVLKDRVKITLDIKIPYPLNNIELHLVV